MLKRFKHLKNKVVPEQQKSDEKLIIGLDIGTENIKALIAKVDGDNQLEIVGVGRDHQSLTDMQAGAIADIAAVVGNCDQALNQAEQQSGLSGRSAVIGIAGELVKGNTTTVRFKRKNPDKRIDVAEVDKIFQLVQEKAEVKAKKQLAAETGGKEIGLKLVFYPDHLIRLY